MLTAMICAGAVTAQFVGGKATRDALFLTSLDLTSLPAMVIATSVFSILLVAANSKATRMVSPARLVPASFLVSSVLLLLEWILTFRARPLAAVLVYLHISGVGPVLGSSFWLISSERFDPRTAKRRFGQIAGAGTLGGLLSALLAERVAAVLGVEAMLPFLAALHLLSAWQVRRLAIQSDPVPTAATPTTTPASPFRYPSDAPGRSGIRVIAEAPYLRYLALLVLLGTTSAALLDYLFKLEAVRTFGRGDNLLRFFAIYYAATSLITFVVQMSSSRFVLERFGLAMTTSTPSFALLAGSVGGLLAPGLSSMVAARGGETVFRGSLFRAGYELFYTPIPAAEKRAAKSIIDVAFDRLGDALGGGMVRAVLLVAPAAQYSTILGLGIVCSAGAIAAASASAFAAATTSPDALATSACALAASATAAVGEAVAANEGLTAAACASTRLVMKRSRSSCVHCWLWSPPARRFSSEGSSATRCLRSSGVRFGCTLHTRSSSVVSAEFHASLSSPSFR